MAKDLFSTQADDYAKYRPINPPELFEFIVPLAPGRTRALDIATGNGQAARALAPYLKRVDAIDISASQIAAATPDPKIVSAVATAEATGYPAHSFDLVTVAQAYHWFDFAPYRGKIVCMDQEAFSPGVALPAGDDRGHHRWPWNLPRRH